MKIIWIIDNKFRELYGLYDLKKKLKKHNIELYLFNIPVWKTAIDLVNPHIIVVPNLYPNSCGPIVEYSYQKKISVFVHSSEAMFYGDFVQNQKYPIYLAKKIDKFLAWSNQDAKFLFKKGLGKKVVISGNLKFDKRHYPEKEQKKNRKIKVIGVPTHSRVISGKGISKNNIPHLIRHLIENLEPARIGFLKFEIDYIKAIVNIVRELKDNYRIIIKASPFEDPNIYKKTFPEIEIFQGEDIRDFLKETDVILNVYSSTAVDALKYNIPVLSISRLINWDETVIEDTNRGPKAKNGPGILSISLENIKELKKILKKNQSELIEKCKKQNLFSKADELAITTDTLNIFTNLFLIYKKKISPKKINYYMIFKYILVELRQTLFRSGRSKKLYRFWSLKDRKLLKAYKIK